MKVVSRFLLLATVPFLALAKNPDARFLKKPKAPKAPKTPKAPAPASKKSPKATQSPTSSPTNPPTGTPTSPQLTQIFYNDYYTVLEEVIEATDDDSDTLFYQFYLDLGHIKGHSSKRETIELVQASFTSYINFDFKMDDDNANTDMEVHAFLEILAYADCDSAAACEAAGVTPTPLIPERVEMDGWYRNIDFSGSPMTDFSWQDSLTSSNEAQFLLADKGTGDFFLKARFTIDMYAYAATHDTALVNFAIYNWVVVVEDGNKNFSATEAVDVYSGSPTTVA